MQTSRPSSEDIIHDPQARKIKRLYDIAIWVIGIFSAMVCVCLMYYERGDLGIIVFFIMVALALTIGAMGMKKALYIQYEADGFSKTILTEKSKRRNKIIYVLLLVYIISLIGIAMYIL